MVVASAFVLASVNGASTMNIQNMQPDAQGAKPIQELAVAIAEVQNSIANQGGDVNYGEMKAKMDVCTHKLSDLKSLEDGEHAKDIENVLVDMESARDRALESCQTPTSLLALVTKRKQLEETQGNTEKLQQNAVKINTEKTAVQAELDLTVAVEMNKNAHVALDREDIDEMEVLRQGLVESIHKIVKVDAYEELNSGNTTCKIEFGPTTVVDGKFVEAIQTIYQEEYEKESTKDREAIKKSLSTPEKTAEKRAAETTAQKIQKGFVFRANAESIHEDLGFVLQLEKSEVIEDSMAHSLENIDVIAGASWSYRVKCPTKYSGKDLQSTFDFVIYHRGEVFATINADQPAREVAGAVSKLVSLSAGTAAWEVAVRKQNETMHSLAHSRRVNEPVEVKLEQVPLLNAVANGLNAINDVRSDLQWMPNQARWVSYPVVVSRRKADSQAPQDHVIRVGENDYTFEVTDVYRHRFGQAEGMQVALDLTQQHNSERVYGQSSFSGDHAQYTFCLIQKVVDPSNDKPTACPIEDEPAVPARLDLLCSMINFCRKANTKADAQFKVQLSESTKTEVVQSESGAALASALFLWMLM